MDILEARDKFIFKTKIQIDNDNYIVLREPTSFELRDFGEDGKANVEILQKIFPKCIIEHTFTDNGQVAKNEKVASFILDSGSTFTEIINIWMQSLPLSKKTDGKSDK